MQGHWKVEIEEKVNEIRMKENVSRTCFEGSGRVVYVGDDICVGCVDNCDKEREYSVCWLCLAFVLRRKDIHVELS